jgi:methylated-DNA-protein-cysteine methyltransferase related protein
VGEQAAAHQRLVTPLLSRPSDQARPRVSPRVRAVLDIVDTIPAGAVMTYGDVATRAGVASARFVGRVLARFGDEVPWQRVVMADGSCARHLVDEQLALLAADATPLTADGRRVDLRRARLALGQLAALALWICWSGSLVSR